MLMRDVRLLSSVVALIFVAFSARVYAGKATIYRDTWGVPHIYADSERSAMFALGYAQAEDRLGSIMKAYRAAEGTLAEAFGPDLIDTDVHQRLFKHAEIGKKHFKDLSPGAQQAIRAFLAGIKQFMKDHPDRVPQWKVDPQPYHVIALSRAIIWNWPLGQAMDDLKRGNVTGLIPTALDDPAFGSNEWVVSRSRTAEHCVIGLIDPHVSCKDEWLFYEAHIHGGNVNTFGYCIVGTPYPGLGHNDYLYWTCTTGGPDTADIYAVDLDPNDHSRYRYDNGWRKVRKETVKIRVKKGDKIETVTRDLLYTHHGPVVKVVGDRLYAAKLSYMNEFRLMEQIRAMNLSHNVGEFLNALNMMQYMPQNIMYGDKFGNLLYVRTGRTPIRPKGYRFDMPVPGNTSKTEWLGIHYPQDLVQILNPFCGFMQNCNISPDTMMPNSPLTADRYPPYIYGASPGASNPRGRRAVKLLSSCKNMTEAQAMAIALDIKLDGVESWRDAIVTACDHYATNAKVKEAADMLRKWDGRMAINSEAATIFYVWWETCRDMGLNMDLGIDLNQNPPTPSEEKQGVAALAKAIKALEKVRGTFHVKWGDVHRGKRGDRSWPLAGIASHGLATLRAIGTHAPDDKGVMYMRSGQSCTTVIFLGEKKIRAFSATPFGQSEDPNSPHYTDQGEKLFAKRKLKPTWYNRKDLAGHIESTTTLTTPF